MICINKFYNIGQIECMYSLNAKSVNKLWIVISSDGKFLLKKYIPKYNDIVLISVSAQEMVHRYLGLSTMIIPNTDGKLLSYFNGDFYSLQEYIDGSYFLLTEKTIKLYLDSIVKLHFVLNQMNINDSESAKASSLSNQEIIDKIKMAQKKYVNLKIANESYEKLLDFRMYYAKELPLVSHKIEYKSIIHGDIRPSNVIFNPKSIKFIDFDYVSKGDLLFELSSSITLLSNFNKKVCEIFWNMYCDKNNLRLSFKQLYLHLLTYYCKSDFPLNIIPYESEDQINRMSLERIKLLEFCKSIIST